MSRGLIAGTLALTVAVTAACGGNDERSGVDGQLRVIGTAYPGLYQPTAGTVSVYPAAEDESPLVSQPVGVEPFAELAVDATGEFRISLPPGTYMLAARSGSGYAWSMQLVDVDAGEYTPITITCFR